MGVLVVVAFRGGSEVRFSTLWAFALVAASFPVWAGAGPASTRAAATTQAAVTQLAKPRARPAPAARPNERARRLAQRQSISALPDGGTFKLHELIRFTVVDGRICSEMMAEFQLGSAARRIRIEGSDAVWMVNTFSNGQSAHHTVIRYDFDAPDSDFWMVSYTFQERSNTASVFAQAGEASEVGRVYYSQQPTGVAVNLSGWDENNRVRQILAVNSADLFQLRSEHPEAVRRYLLPALRKLTDQPILRPGAADAYRVFTGIPADPKVTGRLHELLPVLTAEAPEVRERATRELFALGRDGALAAMRFDPELLVPEQATRLGELIMAHSRMSIEDPEEAARDVQFLIDCLEDDDRAVRVAAADALERHLSRKLSFNPDLPAGQREAFADELRAEVAKEQGKDQFPPSVPAPAPAPALHMRG
jgi:hypothetical protein